MAKVKKLEIKSIMGVEEVNIQPKNELVIIAGDNAQGKTSVIKSLEIALRGKKAMAGISKMVHEGEETGDIIADLGDIIIKRHYTDDGKERLKVTRGKDGTDIKSPEGLLATMLNKMLKPVEFMRMSPKQQKSLLINSLDLDIDLASLETTKEESYNLRTVKGRERDNAKAHLEKMEPPKNWEETAKAEINVGTLVKELEKRKDHNEGISRAQKDMEYLANNIIGINDQIKELEDRIIELKEKKESTKKTMKGKENWLKDILPMDENEIREKIDKVEAQNMRIREANKYRELYKNVETLNGEYSEFTQEIGRIDKTIEASLARAKMPIEGLEIYDDGLGVKGMPLAQVAESEQLKASIGISMGLEPKPELKVLIIENGRDLTEKNWEIVRGMAKENGYQIWVQYVDQSGEIGFVIQEGKIIKINE